MRYFKYFLILLPVVAAAAILVFLHRDAADRINDRINARVERCGVRLDALDGQVEELKAIGLDAIGGRIEELQALGLAEIAKVNGRFDNIEYDADELLRLSNAHDRAVAEQSRRESDAMRLRWETATRQIAGLGEYAVALEARIRALESRPAPAVPPAPACEWRTIGGTDYYGRMDGAIFRYTQWRPTPSPQFCQPGAAK